MSTGYPINKDNRIRTFTVSAGQTTFGPFTFKIWDVADVALQTRGSSYESWQYIIGGVTITLTGPAPAEFTLTKAGLTPGAQYRVIGLRIPDRITNVTKGGAISSSALERVLDILTTENQEIRRDAAEAFMMADQVRAQADSVFANVSPPVSITSAMLVAGVAQANLGFTPEDKAQKNQPTGYAGLDAAGKLDPAMVPDKPFGPAQIEVIQDTAAAMLQGVGGFGVTYNDDGALVTLTPPPITASLEAGIGVSIVPSASKHRLDIQDGRRASAIASYAGAWVAADCHYAWITADGLQIMAAGNLLGAGSPFSTGLVTFANPLAVAPGQVQPALPWVSVACGYQNTFAIDSLGAVYACGRNNAGQLGIGNLVDQGGLNKVAVGPCSTVVPAKTGFTSSETTFFLLQNGQAWAVGRNATGQLGDGTIIDKSTPVRCGALEGVTKLIACAASPTMTSVMALGANGQLWAWGYGVSSVLGNGSTSNVTVPFATLSGVVDFDLCALQSAGVPMASALAVLQSGAIRAIGVNAHGQLLDGTLVDKTAWVNTLVTSGAARVRTGALSTATSLVLMQDGTIRTGGFNGQGQCGGGDVITPKTALQTPSLNGVTGIFVGGFASKGRLYAITDAGANLRAWGYGTAGALGVGGVPAAQSTPAVVPLPGVASAGRIKDIQLTGSIDNGGVAILTASGEVFFTGTNESSFWGNGATTGIIAMRPVRG